MKLTIGKKLTFSFLLLACLVLLSGIVGIFVLNKVTTSTDTVVKEKVPVEFAVMKAESSIGLAEKYIAEYIHSASNLDEIKTKLSAKLDEFEMWIEMVKYGTSSDKFQNSKSYKLYKTLRVDIIVPQSSTTLLKAISKLTQQGIAFKKECMELIKAQDEYLRYSVTVNDKNYTLPTYLLLLQEYNTAWFKALEDATLTVLKFEQNTDPTKGMIGNWIQTYKVDDQTLNKLIKRIDKYQKKMMRYVAKINKENSGEGKTKYFQRNRGNFKQVDRNLGRIRQYIEPIYQKLETSKAAKLSTLKKAGLMINKELGNLVNEAQQEMDMAMNIADSAKKSGTTFLIVLTIIAVLIAALFGIYISRYLTKNITALAGVTKLIAQGNLKNKVEISSQDELGDLANDTNAMTDNLRKIMNQISEFSKQLTSSSSDLSNLASSMSEGAGGMTQKSESVAAAAEEMSTNMNSVAATSEQAATNINTVSIATDEINSSINEIAKNSETGSSITQEAVEKAGNATEKVNELGNAAKEISKVTEVISEISAQTNLLALNATIEAARAGEAGKGFAVVASEIKQLAIQTTEATNDIKKRIESIQNSTSDTALEIEGVTKIIGTINEIVGTIAAAVEEQSATTKEISQNMAQASTGLQEVTENVAQSNNVSSEIARDIGDVNTSSNEVLSNSKLVNTNSGELKKLAANLQELVNQFKL